MKILKIIGARTEPCGAPVLMWHNELKDEPIFSE